MRIEAIRNFSIIAHIDHGKSTLADRILEITGAITEREFREQILDDMELERERGITIKARSVTIYYTRDDKTYQLNLIDTPGHVDFAYEVSRSLAACEGAILLVDATQGVEAQTVANLHLAMDQGLDIIPVLNKIDVQAAQPDEIASEMETSLAMTSDEILSVSAKTGKGVTALLDALVDRITPPEGEPDGDLRALIFDSVFNSYRGVIVHTRIIDGVLKTGQMIQLASTGAKHEVTEVGIFAPAMKKVSRLEAGQVGYMVASIKTIDDVAVGDTIMEASRAVTPLPGFKEPKPVVYCGIYPADGQDVSRLREALEKLRLNDSSFTFQPESSEALGFGFRCGFLGLLHMEIVQERLSRELNVEVIQTAPNTTYEVVLKDGVVQRIERAADLPEPNMLEEIREPIVMLSLIIPSTSIGPIMKLMEQRLAVFDHTEYISPARVIMTFKLPLSEVLFDFHDRLKSITRGFGTMDYHVLYFKPADLVRLDILVASKKVDALSAILHREHAENRGRKLIGRLKKNIPRHLFAIPIQAAIGSKVIARVSVKALAKNVTAKCYGGDVTRKRKLLEKQKEGKKRMKKIGSVSLTQEAFMSVLSSGED